MLTVGRRTLAPGRSVLLLCYRRQCSRHPRHSPASPPPGIMGGTAPFGSFYHHEAGGRNITDAHFWDVFGEHFGTAVCSAQTALETLHTVSGLPWWGTIMMTSFILRLVTLPVRLTGLLHQARARAATLDLSYQLPAIRERVAHHLAQASSGSPTAMPMSISSMAGKKEQRGGGTGRGTASGKKQANGNALAKYELTRAWLEAMRARGTHPLRSLLPVLLHLPLFFILTATLRKMSAYPWPFSPPSSPSELMVPGWEMGGMLFFTHLGSPSGWLTLLVFASGVGTIESIFGGQSMPSPSTRRLQLWRWTLHGINVISVYLLSLLPAAINLFLLTNNLLVVGEGQLLRARLIRGWVERQVNSERLLAMKKPQGDKGG